MTEGGSKPEGPADALPLEDCVLIQRKLLKRGLYDPAIDPGAREGPMPLYPYAKGPDFANDGMGYGELITVKAYQLVRRVLKRSQDGTSRRTRSGRQLLRHRGEHSR